LANAKPMLGCVVPFASTQYLGHKYSLKILMSQINISFIVLHHIYIYIYIYIIVVMGSGMETFMSYIKILLISRCCLL